MNRALPESYIDLGPVALHPEDLSRFTSDVDRFVRCLPAVKRLWDMTPGTAEEQAIWAEANHDELLVSLAEYWDFIQRLAYTQRLMAGPKVDVH